MNEARFLLAVDLDGTLLRNDKTIAPEDLAAIQGAAAAGIVVTLATGRLVNNTLPIARQLGLFTPLICADGGLLVDAETGALLHANQIAHEHAALALDTLAAEGLVRYVLMPDAIHCEEAGECHRALMSTYSREIVIHASLASAPSWRTPEGVSMTVGIGSRESVERACELLCKSQADTLDTVYFGLLGMSVWAVRSLPKGCDKGEMLARLAASLNIPRARVAAVGDWFNDLGMFKFSGRSFAMGQSPDYVREAATHTLRATSQCGGGVAEAMQALLASSALV